MDNKNKSGEIVLKSGEVYNVENILTLPDSSIKFNIVRKLYDYIPLNKIKEVRYKNIYCYPK